MLTRRCRRRAASGINEHPAAHPRGGAPGPGSEGLLLVHDPAVYPVVVDAAPAVAAEASPGVPEKQGDHQAHGADDHEDQADGVDVEVVGAHLDGEVQDGPYRY